ncbi:glycosyl hydrolase [Mariniphaga sediminis]|uniref:glycosyl hydrolase n=1 Tax=Mariniphaga sediminis TaxID=1628158 RepID=UPI003561666C
MKRRTFLSQSMILSAGFIAARFPAFGTHNDFKNRLISSGLFSVFKDVDSTYRPFVRWWWNGDKVEKKELIRELHLLKEAGIGGVEINPIEFPSTGDDLGKKSLKWLSDEWIEMLQITFDEAKKLNMTCDLIVGSGWPFGAETLERNERAQVALVYAEQLEGPTQFETSRFNIFDQVDPGVSVPCPSRTFDILSLKLVPAPMSSLDQVIDLTDKLKDQIIQVDVPAGKHFFYALVKVDSFASVINGAPGAAGPILNHMDKEAVRKYLDHMSDTIQKQTGPLANHLRAFFTDSMELEGCNWNEDLPVEFKKRRGYDLMPYLPFTMFKVGRLGAVVDANYGVTKTGDFAEEIKRVRFDFELTKAELLYERFTQTYLEWCKDNNVKSRAQAYGRAFFPLETSLGYDIPEGESWTTNWLKHRVGEEMSDDDYRRGRGYTMINKYVSSAAHLEGKRIVSCEEMTNTYNVFNITLEQLKIGSDMSIMSGITHSVWHGFNYSPPEAPFPGWVQYGSYYSENNNWWPYFKYLNQYKARISSLLQNADMFTDMVILPPNYDMWGEMGVQTDPFPEKLNVQYTSIIWESINKTGGAADYTTEIIINKSTVKGGKLCYGPKEYGTIFLPEVTSIGITTLKKLLEFVASGGRIFCIEKYPEKSLGLKDWQQRDAEVSGLVEKLKSYKDKFILLRKPIDNRFLEWYMQVMEQYTIPHYLSIEKPNRFFMQTRYQADDGSEIFYFQNVHMHLRYKTNVSFSKTIVKGRYPWVWDPETGERYRIQLHKNSCEIDLGPAESRIIVFCEEKDGKEWKPIPISGEYAETINNDWKVELRHSREHTIEDFEMSALTDLKETKYVNFTGTAVYKRIITLKKETSNYMNLGKVWGVSELFVNGKSCGVKWYGDRIYNLAGKLNDGANEIEIHVITSMGNYMKTLTDNETAQKFTLLKNKNQPIQSMGMLGPVTIY